MGNFWRDFWAQVGTGKERMLSLPYPPSVNHLWRHVVIRGAVRTLLSADGRKYKDAVRAKVYTQIGFDVSPFSGRLAVALIVYPPDRRRRDIDNVFKVLGDALSPEKGKVRGFPGLWLDDSQIDILHVERGHVHREGGCVRVHVLELGEGAA